MRSSTSLADASSNGRVRRRPPAGARLATRIEQHLERASARGQAKLILFDLDGFAALAEGGTIVADEQVQRLREAIARNLPEGEVLPHSRDGFAVVIELQLTRAILAAEAVRAELERSGGCRVSAGVAALGGPEARGVAAQVWAAHEALQEAKGEGGDRVVVGHGSPMVLKSTYYPRAQLERLSRISRSEARSEASLLREALEHLLSVYES